jgi:hypothetical protein
VCPDHRHINIFRFYKVFGPDRVAISVGSRYRWFMHVLKWLRGSVFYQFSLIMNFCIYYLNVSLGIYPHCSFHSIHRNYCVTPKECGNVDFRVIYHLQKQFVDTLDVLLEELVEMDASVECLIAKLFVKSLTPWCFVGYLV